MGKLKQMSLDKAYALQDRLAAEARAKFIGQVMEWEECGYEEAYAICTGQTDPIEYEYTLGYKMSDPLYMMAMNLQLTRRQREEAKDSFETLLCPEELELFRKEVRAMNTRDKMKAALRRKKKEADDEDPE